MIQPGDTVQLTFYNHPQLVANPQSPPTPQQVKEGFALRRQLQEQDPFLAPYGSPLPGWVPMLHPHLLAVIEVRGDRLLVKHPHFDRPFEVPTVNCLDSQVYSVLTFKS